MFALSQTIRAAAFAVTLAVASFAFTPQAQAAEEDKTPPSYGALMVMSPQDVMHLIDSKNEGAVTREDYMVFHARMFEKMDKNKDGKISESEWIDRSSDAGG